MEGGCLVAGVAEVTVGWAGAARMGVLMEWVTALARAAALAGAGGHGVAPVPLSAVTGVGLNAVVGHSGRGQVLSGVTGVGGRSYGPFKMMGLNEV